MAKINFGKLAEAGKKFFENLGKHKAQGFGNFKGAGNFQNIHNKIADLRKKLNGGDELGGYKPSNKVDYQNQKPTKLGYENHVSPVGNGDEPVIVNASVIQEIDEPPFVPHKGPNLEEGLENPTIGTGITDDYNKHMDVFNDVLEEAIEQSGGRKDILDVVSKEDSNGSKYDEISMKNGDVIKVDQANLTGIAVDYADPNANDYSMRFILENKPGEEYHNPLKVPFDDDYQTPPIIKDPLKNDFVLISD